MDRRLGGPLPHQLPNPTRAHPCAINLWQQEHASPLRYAVLVFRVLGGFAMNGRALELRAAGNETRYDYNVEPHYHAHCQCCGRVADVKVEGLKERGLKVTAESEFDVSGYSVEFYGVCGECRKKEEIRA